MGCGGGGGLQNWSGGRVRFYPYKNGGSEKVLAMLNLGGGHKRIKGSSSMGE